MEYRNKLIETDYTIIHHNKTISNIRGIYLGFQNSVKYDKNEIPLQFKSSYLERPKFVFA